MCAHPTRQPAGPVFDGRGADKLQMYGNLMGRKVTIKDKDKDGGSLVPAMRNAPQAEEGNEARPVLPLAAPFAPISPAFHNYLSVSSLGFSSAATPQ